MDVVWAADRPVTGREVVDELARSRPIAYTTVVTVLQRLVRKGILVKGRAGRVYTFSAAQSREAYTARLLASVLGEVEDRAAVLLRFMDQLPPAEAKRLRAALADREDAGPGRQDPA